MSIRIEDMPNLGSVTDASEIVGEKAGSGVFSATALKSYLGSGYLANTGGTVSGLTSFPAGISLNASGTAGLSGDASTGAIHALHDVSAGGNLLVAGTTMLTGPVTAPGGIVASTLTVSPGLASMNNVSALGVTCTGVTCSGNVDAISGVLNGKSLAVATNATIGGTLGVVTLTANSINSVGGVSVGGMLTTAGLTVTGAAGFASFTATNIVCTQLNASGVVVGSSVQSASSYTGATLALTGAATIGGDVATQGQVAFGGAYDSNLRIAADATLTMLQYNPTGARLQHVRSTGETSFIGSTTAILQFGNTSLTCYHAAAAKPGGGPWDAVSDARIKTVHGDYTLGLDELLLLNPVTFTYRGNDALEVGGPPLNSPDSGVHVGLVAQDAEAVWPDLVRKSPGAIDGIAVDDLRTLMTGDLTFALINAVRALDERLRALEAA